jgi:hypothetical protein
MEIKFDILDYMGKINDGVLALISLTYKEEFYEGTFFYTKNMLAITVDERLEEDLKTTIEEWPEYNDLMKSIIDKVVPYDEIYSRLDEVDFTPYLPKDENSDNSDFKYVSELDPSEVISATQS